MGRRILQLALKDSQFHIVGGVARSDVHATIGSLVGDRCLQAPISSDPQNAFAECDVAIDFTSHEATRDYLQAALATNKALVIGTTGHTPEGKKAIEDAAKIIPILYSPNFSFGIALCLEAVARFGKALYGTCAIDIIETHHVHKKDRPSGTAFAFAAAVGNGRVSLEGSSAQPRRKEEIVVHSIRSGEVIGEHIIIFESGHERIELKHTAHSRDAFAQGALMGAKFLAKKPPGLYSLKDMFVN
ncbi:MAG: 4-hydroxy-tetrahydrodipicolinate reductase [Candidatus Melainabacteria bacterium]|nr:4-hydroxy-tetrahydrodipicolinate reductase [Candidatus Melainabacteria bacterium]